MRCAIYARKSTEDDRHDEDKSTTRQIEHAKQFIKEKGWTALEEHIYLDDGISGGSHSHSMGGIVRPTPNEDGDRNGNPRWAAQRSASTSSANHTHSMTSTGDHSHSITGGDAETRPINAYVNWIIKT